MLMRLKNILLVPLLKFIFKHPGIMESRLFLKAMQVFPAKISKTYDQKVAESGIKYQAALKEGLTRIPAKPQSILDLCTGTGSAAFNAAELFPSAQIDAVDQASEMIEIARVKAQKIRKSDTIRFKKGDATNLDYSDNRFDLIITSNAPVYLNEAARVLKKDGFILAAYSFGGMSFLKARKQISDFLDNQGLKLIEVNSAGNGAYIIGQKQ
jgi:ubiquinone/menaquinone biosynthesis C-methylase UbiE